MQVQRYYISIVTRLRGLPCVGEEGPTVKAVVRVHIFYVIFSWISLLYMINSRVCIEKKIVGGQWLNGNGTHCVQACYWTALSVAELYSVRVRWMQYEFALTGKYRFTWRKICPSATLSITDPTWTGLRLNSGSFAEKSGTMPWHDLCTVLRRQYSELADKKFIVYIKHLWVVWNVKIEERTGVYRGLVGKPEERRPLERLRRRW